MNSEAFPIMEHFNIDGMSRVQQRIARPYLKVAEQMIDELTPSAEVAAGLRKLLESRDCMMREIK